MTEGTSPEPPTDGAGEESAPTGDSPWWSADDDSFAGATPLFDGARRRHPDDPPLFPPPPTVDDVGTPIGEALKLASAALRWSEESGLSDTLRQLAVEAREALSGSAHTGSLDDDGSERSIPLHSMTSSDADDPPLVCDYCPLCRGVDVMRSVQPQMSQGLAEGMASLTAALNFAVEGFVRRQGGNQK